MIYSNASQKSSVKPLFFRTSAFRLSAVSQADRGTNLEFFSLAQSKMVNSWLAEWNPSGRCSTLSVALVSHILPRMTDLKSITAVYRHGKAEAPPNMTISYAMVDHVWPSKGVEQTALLLPPPAAGAPAAPGSPADPPSRRGSRRQCPAPAAPAAGSRSHRVPHLLRLGDCRR